MRCSTLRTASLLTASMALAVFAMSSCSEKPAPKPKTTTAAPKAADGHAHAHADGDKDHAHDHADGDHDVGMAGGNAAHGPSIRLGANTVDGVSFTADRDEGAVTAGGEIAVDVDVNAASKPNSVRFWVGSEDGKGSVKARAEIEDPKKPNRWHTHAEVPKPLADGAKLWVEVEFDGGRRVRSSFPLTP